jgi:hypothetical protein
MHGEKNGRWSIGRRDGTRDRQSGRASCCCAQISALAQRGIRAAGAARAIAICRVVSLHRTGSAGLKGRDAGTKHTLALATNLTTKCWSRLKQRTLSEQSSEIPLSLDGCPSPPSNPGPRASRTPRLARRGVFAVNVCGAPLDCGASGVCIWLAAHTEAALTWLGQDAL